MLSEGELLERAKAYLKSVYNEDTVSMLIVENNVTDGSGALTVECTVKTGFFTSDWRKTFVFADGRVVNMTWLPRLKLLRRWHRRRARPPAPERRSAPS